MWNINFINGFTSAHGTKSIAFWFAININMLSIKIYPTNQLPSVGVTDVCNSGNRTFWILCMILQHRPTSRILQKLWKTWQRKMSYSGNNRLWLQMKSYPQPRKFLCFSMSWHSYILSFLPMSTKTMDTK